MSIRINGNFEVTLQPQAAEENVGDPSIGRMSIDKRFHGDLDGTSRGEMLSVRTDVAGSAGYVAIERVTGTLQGKQGSFALQHSGIMKRGLPDLTITVIPDSGTGELAGIIGSMRIDNVEGNHTYYFDYDFMVPA